MFNALGLHVAHTRSSACRSENVATVQHYRNLRGTGTTVKARITTVNILHKFTVGIDDGYGDKRDGNTMVIGLSKTVIALFRV